MKQRLSSAILVLLLAPLHAGELYKWVDEDGNVHYSDKPVEGAEAVKLPEPATFDAPAVQQRPVTRQEGDDQPEEEKAVYRAVAFISPKAEQVFWATGGQVPVQLDLKPGLRPGHRVNLYLDGELVPASPMQSLGTTLEQVFRGAHTVRAVIIDRDGRELIATEPVTFHIKQHSIANPQRRSGN